MSRSTVTFLAGIVAALLLTGGGVAFWYQRPTRLTVAISAADAEDFNLMNAASKLLKTSKTGVRLHLEVVDSAGAAASSADADKADLAVIRTDVAVPNNAQTVVILHRDSALLVAPPGSELESVGDLSGHTIGIVRRGPGNEQLLATTLAQYDIPTDAVKTVALKPDEIAGALRSKTVDVILAVDILTGPDLRAIVKAAALDGGTPVFIPIAEADAIAQQSPAYEKTEVMRGAFGGSPPRPADEYDTLSVTHRLVANENVSQDVITNLTRFFLTEKMQIASSAPIAQRIEAPNTDKGAALPVHAGSAAYIDDDEQTFFDKYSDMIYLGAMLLGVLASGATAVMSRLNSGRIASIGAAVSRLIEMLALVRAASSPAALDALEQEADQLMASAIGAASTSGGDENRLSTFSLALDQVRAAVRDRRAQLAVGAPFDAAGPALPTLVRTAAE